MGDDLGEEWWKEEEVEDVGDNEGSHDVIEEDKKDDDLSKVRKRRGSPELKENYSEALVTDEPKTKKRRKRKRITEASLPSSGGSLETFTNCFFDHFNQLSVVEKMELSLEGRHITVCNVEKNHTLTSYLKQAFPKWRKISVEHTHKMSPLILFICGNALRASNISTEVKTFKGKEHKSMKLFSRHMKIEEQMKTLKNDVIHFGVGTPARIKSLLQQDAMTLEHTRAVVVDWNWRDLKMKTMVDVKEVKSELMNLLKDFVIPSCKKSHLKIGLF